MRKRFHIFIWSLVGLVLALALYSGQWRRGYQPSQAAAPEPAQVVERAVALLAEDPKLFQSSTQDAVRAAAVATTNAGLASAEAALVLGTQFAREQNLLRAEEQLRRAVEVRPDWAAANAALGDLVARHTAGGAAEAETLLRRAVALAPDWALPHDSLAILLRHGGRMEEAEREAGEALRLAPEDVAVLNNYANLMFQLERYEEAETHYRLAIRANPAHPKPWYNLACFYTQQGRPDDALEHLARSIELSPVFRNEAAVDPDLEPLRALPRFDAIVYGGIAEAAG